MVRWHVAIGGVCLLAGLTLGHYTAPTTEKTKTITVKSSTTETAKNVEHGHTGSVREVVRWRTKTIVRPDGVREETTETETRNEAATETKTSSAEATKTVEVQTVTVEKVKLVEAPRPRWALAASYGADLGGGQHFGGGVEARVVGPIWLTAHVDVPARAGMLGLRVEF